MATQHKSRFPDDFVRGATTVAYQKLDYGRRTADVFSTRAWCHYSPAWEPLTSIAVFGQVSLEENYI